MSLRKITLHTWRRISQFVFGVFITNGYIPVIWTKTLYNGPLRNFCVPILNCHSCPTSTMACPIGMLQHFAGAHQIPYFIIGFLGATGMIFGRAACGWLCPFGLLQDMMFKINSVKIRIPKIFSYFKYVFLLVLVIILPYITDVHWFSRLCPWGGIIGAIPWVVWNPVHPDIGIPAVPEGAVGFWFVLKMIIVAFFLVLFVIAKRPFCYTSCPLGAIYSFFNRFSLFKVYVDENCTQCNHCREKCPTDLEAHDKANNTNCVECYECTECEHVKLGINLDSIKLPFSSKPEIACREACPLGTEAWRYIAYINRGEYEKAYKAIREPNPFPSVCARVCTHPCETKCDAGKFGEKPIAIRALKRFITDRIDPSVYKPLRLSKNGRDSGKIAIIGAGPAGLTAAHYLSLKGYRVTVFEKESRPGGMLLSCIPEYRLPRNILNNEIKQLIDNNIGIRYNCNFGKDITIDSLEKEDYNSIFIATGAHINRRMNIENENIPGVFPSMRFLKEYNLNGVSLAKGKVGVIGGGNAAIDSARVALRQKDVESVTILYRRTRAEMPAFYDEIEAAIKEGVSLKTLLSPVKIHVENNTLTGIKCIKNRLDKPDSSGRKRPVPVPGSEEVFPLDTIIVAISEQPDIDTVSGQGVRIGRGMKPEVNQDTMETSLPGVFAGGDVVTGPNVVVEAIAAGKKAAEVIHTFISGEKPVIEQKSDFLPEYIDPQKHRIVAGRAVSREADVSSRINSFIEIEKVLPEEDAKKESGRCLRCDLKFSAKCSGKKSA